MRDFRALDKNLQLRLVIMFLSAFGYGSLFSSMTIYYNAHLGAAVTGGLLAFSAVGSFVVNLVSGHLADTRGRKVVLDTGLAAGFVGMGIALAANTAIVNAWPTFAGFFLDGLGFAAVTTASNAMLVDVSTPANRKIVFALDYWAQNLSVILGAALGAWLFRRYFVALLAISLLIALAIFLIAFFGMTETLPSHGGMGPVAADGGLARDEIGATETDGGLPRDGTSATESVTASTASGEEMSRAALLVAPSTAPAEPLSRPALSVTASTASNESMSGAVASSTASDGEILLDSSPDADLSCDASHAALSVASSTVPTASPSRDESRSEVPVTTSTGSTNPASPPDSIFKSYLTVLRDRTYMIYLLANTLSLSIILQFDNFLPIHLADSFRTTRLMGVEIYGQRMLTIYLMIACVLVVVFMTTVNRLTAGWHYLTGFVVGLVPMSLGLAMAFMTRDLLPIVISCVIYTAGEMLYTPSVQALGVTLMDPEKIGAYQGASASRQPLGSIIAAALVTASPAIGAIGVSAALVLSAVAAMLLGTLAVSRHNRDRQR